MAPPRIPINQAADTNLQELTGIGAKRAARIIKYRAEVSPINDVYALSNATGLGLKQANDLAEFIEWSAEEEFDPFRFVIPGLVFAGSSLMILYGLAEISFDFNSPATILYNTSLLLIMIGCVSVMSEQLLFFIYKERATPGFLMMLSVISSLSGIACLISFASLNLFFDLTHDISADMTLTANFLLFVFLIFFLLYAPGIHLKRINLYKNTRLTSIDLGALVFDVGQLLFAILVLLILTRLNSNLWLEEIFAIWASVILAGNGFELIQGRSAYFSLLGEQEKATLRFLLMEDADRKSPYLRPVFMKITGAVLLCSGIGLSGISAFRFLGW